MATRGQSGDLKCRMWLISLMWNVSSLPQPGCCRYMTLLAVPSPLSPSNCYFGLFFHFQRYGSEGLKLVNHEETVSFGQAVLKLTFDPGSPDDGMLTAECRLDHPFFVKTKGKVNSSCSICVINDYMLFNPPSTIFRMVFILSKPYCRAPWDPLLWDAVRGCLLASKPPRCH